MKAIQIRKEAVKRAVLVIILITIATINITGLAASGGSVPTITVTPTAFAGASSFTTLLSYAMYGAWLVVFGMIIYAAIEAARGNHMGDTFKRILVGVVIAAFLLTFGWAIISGVF